MKTIKGDWVIHQLEKRKGGYYFLKIAADIVDQFENKRHTRFQCIIDNAITFPCGLNHLGDGNFFIILSSKNIKALKKTIGDSVFVELSEHPSPLGVDMPPVLEALLAQDDDLNRIFESFTLGKKRTVIHYIDKVKDIDKQVQKLIQFINDGAPTHPKRS